MVMSFVCFGDGHLKAATKRTEALTSHGATWRRQGSADISCIEGGFILTEQRYFFIVIYRSMEQPPQGHGEFSITGRFFSKYDWTGYSIFQALFPMKTMRPFEGPPSLGCSVILWLELRQACKLLESRYLFLCIATKVLLM